MALLQAYASVFTYMFAIATFVSPALTVLLLSIISRLRLRRGSWQFDLIADFLPQMYLPPESLGKWRTVNRIRNYIVSSLGSSVSHNTVSDRKDIPMLPQQLKLQSQQSEDSDIRQTSIESPIADSELKIRYVNTLGESKHNYSSDTKVDVVSNRSEAAAMLSLSQRSSRLPKSIFNTNTFILQMAQLMCVIFSFGMAFPPLAVLGFVAIWSKMSFVQMMMRRFRRKLTSTAVAAAANNSIDKQTEADKDKETETKTDKDKEIEIDIETQTAERMVKGAETAAVLESARLGSGTVIVQQAQLEDRGALDLLELDVKRGELLVLGEVLDRNCERAAIFMRHSLWLCYPSGIIVLSFFVFDMIGGVFPGPQEQYAAILPCVMMGVLGLSYMCWACVNKAPCESFSFSFAGCFGCFGCFEWMASKCNGCMGSVFGIVWRGHLEANRKDETGETVQFGILHGINNKDN